MYTVSQKPSPVFLAVTRESIVGDGLKLTKHLIRHFSEMMLFLNYCILSGSAEALVRCGGKL